MAVSGRACLFASALQGSNLFYNMLQPILALPCSALSNKNSHAYNGPWTGGTGSDIWI